MTDEVGGGSPTEHAASQSAEALALREEMKGIMQTEGYKRQDPATMKMVEEKYKKVYGDKPVSLDSGLSLKAGETPDERRAGDAAAVEDYAPVLKQTEEVLRKEWGTEYDSNLDLARGVALTIFGDKPEVLDRMMSAYLKEGGSPLEANKIFFKLSQLMRKAGS